MQLDGSLSRFALRELLELSVNSLVSGAIEVHAPTGIHRIFFVEGQCVHVTSPDASGFEALWPLFELSDAPFRFVAGQIARERTVSEPTLQLVEQAEALARQWSKIRPYIPTLAIVPRLATPPDGEQVRIYEEDWPVLSWVDGARSIAEIARAAILDPLEVCVGLLRLKERGLVTLSQQAVAPPAPLSQREAPPPAPPRAAAPPVPTSFFARLLTDVPEEVFADVPTTAASSTSSETTPATPAAPPTEYDDILRLLRT